MRLFFASFFSVFYIASAGESRGGDFEVAETCSSVARGFSQLSVVIAQFERVDADEQWKRDLVLKKYKTLKAELIALDWNFRVIAGPRAYGVVYEAEEKGNGMINIAIGLADDVMLPKFTGSVPSENTELTRELLELRSNQLIVACRSDFIGN